MKLICIILDLKLEEKAQKLIKRYSINYKGHNYFMVRRKVYIYQRAYADEMLFTRFYWFSSVQI